MTPRLWQRQPDETPADFTAFAAYLRLKGRRSARAVAALTGRSPATIRRLSARFNWPGRVAAFETRLAEATQEALDSVLQHRPAAAKADLEVLRQQEYELALGVINASRHWLELATNPRRRQVSLTQICRLTEMASLLARLATGLPTGQGVRRRPRPEDRPGYWTAPPVEEALEKIYGDPLPGELPPAPGGQMAGDAATGPPATVVGTNPTAAPTAAVAGSPPSDPVPASVVRAAKGPTVLVPNRLLPPPPPDPPPVAPRCDAWSRWARQMRRMKS